MPRYEFECRDCEQRQVIFLKVDDRNELQVCENCGSFMIRLISRPYLTTNPHHLRDENRLRPVGMSERDYTAERKEEDAYHEKRVNDLGLSKSDFQTPTLEQVAREMGDL